MTGKAYQEQESILRLVPQALPLRAHSSQFHGEASLENHLLAFAFPDTRQAVCFILHPAAPQVPSSVSPSLLDLSHLSLSLCHVAGTSQCFLDPGLALHRTASPPLDVYGSVILQLLTKHCSLRLFAALSKTEVLWKQ